MTFQVSNSKGRNFFDLLNDDLNSIELLSSKGSLLQSMPPGDNMDMGKGYDDNNWLRRSSLSQHLM